MTPLLDRHGVVGTSEAVCVVSALFSKPIEVTASRGEVKVVIIPG